MSWVEIRNIGHRKEIQKLVFREIALRCDEGPVLETSAFQCLYGGQLTLYVYQLRQQIQIFVFGNSGRHVLPTDPRNPETGDR